MSNILVSEINGFKLYNLSKGRTLQELLESVNFNYKRLKRNEEYSNRIELIQDFTFPIASSCMKLSDDGSHMFCAGVYAPRLKIFDLNEMTLKVERGVDSEVRRVCPISDDFTKCALLLEDRSIELHAQYGKHHVVRIPKFGRDMIYNKYTAELISCGTGNDIWRLNLNEGRFMKSYETEIEGINSIRYNNKLNILGACGTEGKIEIWDLRTHSKAAYLPVSDVYNSNQTNLLYNNFFNGKIENTSIEFSNFLMAVGNKSGSSAVFDLRYPNPLFTVKHSYKLPIISVKFHDTSDSIITVDSKLIKFSNSKTGKIISNVEANHNINDFEIYQGSGMFFTANESPKMDIFFAPGLGPAPKWCSFIEKITEELEENNTNTLAEDKKFLDQKALEELSCTNLIGTKFLTPYMHGYFMDLKMYKKLKSLAEPFNYQKYLEEKKQEKINKILDNKIIIKNKSKIIGSNTKADKNVSDIEVKVNQELVNKDDVVNDSRFASKLFGNEDFKIDYNSTVFKQKRMKEKKSLLKENNDNSDLKAIIENEYDNNALDLNEDSKRGKSKDMIVNKDILELREKINRKKAQNKRLLFSNNITEGVSYEEKVKNLVKEDLHSLEGNLKSKIKNEQIKSIKLEKKKQMQNNKEGRRLLYPGKK
jgi:ribosome biogenesis protein ENP2